MHGRSGTRIAQLWRNLAQRHQDKGPLHHPRMRNLEIVRAEHQTVIKQNVQIQRARPVGDARAAVAAELALDHEQGLEQLARTSIRLEAHRGIYEPRLIVETYRSRRI